MSEIMNEAFYYLKLQSWKRLVFSFINEDRTDMLFNL